MADVRTCTLDDCDRPLRSRGYCIGHYTRWRKHGDPRGGRRGTLGGYQGSTCEVESCERAPVGRSFCKMHYARWRKWGDPNIVYEWKPTSWPSGAEHYHWQGEAIQYGAAHDRVRAVRGSASTHVCIDCGGPALHWALKHDAQGIRQGRIGKRVGRWSPHPDDYQPMCAKCHSAYDRKVAV